MNTRKEIPLFADVVFLVILLVVTVFGSGIWKYHAEAPESSLLLLIVCLSLGMACRHYYQRSMGEADPALKNRHMMKGVAFLWLVLAAAKIGGTVLFTPERADWVLAVMAILQLAIPAFYFRQSMIPLDQWPQWMRGPKTWAEIQEEKRLAKGAH